MANVTVYNMEGKEVGTIELNDAVFGVEINEHLVHMAVAGIPSFLLLKSMILYFFLLPPPWCLTVILP